MSFYQTLGIVKSASLQDIKRAYAAKLKLHRPDEDPEGFQKIHTAYQWVLEKAKQRDASISSGSAPDEADEDGFDENYRPEDDNENEEFQENKIFENANKPDREALRTDAGRPNTLTDHFEQKPDFTPSDWEPQKRSPDRTGQNFNLQEFFAEITEAGKTDKFFFKNWLEEHPAMYSIQLKHQIVEPLLMMLMDLEEPFSTEKLETLFDFLSLNSLSINDQRTSLMMNHLRLKSESYWRTHYLARSFESRSTRAIDRMLFQEIKSGKINFPRRFFILAFPGLLKRIAEIAYAFLPDADYPGKPIADQSSISFWLDVANPRKISRWRLLGVVSAIMIPGLALHYLFTQPGELSISLFFSGTLLALWFIYAICTCAYLFIKEYFIEEKEFHPRHVYTVPLVVFTMAISAIQSQVTFLLALIANLMALALTLSKDGKEGFRFLALLTAISLMYAFYMLSMRFEKTAAAELTLFCLIPAFSIGLLILHDLALMHFKKMRPDVVNDQYKYLATAMGLAIAGALLLN